MAAATEFSDGERVIIRNQRYIMLALSNLLQTIDGTAHGFHANKLIERVRSMERTYDWIASPSERLGD